MFWIGYEYIIFFCTKWSLNFILFYFNLACKNEPTNSKYWQYLGTTQASNEHDLVAIKALKKCISIEPTNLTALMALAVCYTNESMHQGIFNY